MTEISLYKQEIQHRYVQRQLSNRENVPIADTTKSHNCACHYVVKAIQVPQGRKEKDILLEVKGVRGRQEAYLQPQILPCTMHGFLYL